MVWKDTSGQCNISFSHTTASGTSATTYPLLMGITLGSSYLCYAEIQVGAGTDGKEILRAGAIKADDFAGSVNWAKLNGESETVQVELITDSSFPNNMAVAGPYGSNGGYFRADELVVGTMLADILPVAGMFAVGAEGAPTVGQNSFSTDWVLVADAGVTADVDVLYDTVDTFATATTVSLGTGLDADTRTLTLTGLEPATTYWWKLYADNGTATAESSPASFTTTGAPILGDASAVPDGNTVAFSAALTEAALGDTLSTSVSVFYGTDGENWTEVQLGSATKADSWTETIGNLAYGTTYQWFVRATATMQGGRVLATDSATNSFTTLWAGDMYVDAEAANPVNPYSTPETAAPDMILSAGSSSYSSFHMGIMVYWSI